MSVFVREAPAGYSISPLGLLVPDRPRREYDLPVAIDFFAGAGGFSMGLHQAGFHVAAAVEMDQWAAITYMVNLGRSARYGGVQMHYDTPERGDAFEETMRKHLGLTRGKASTMMSASAGPVAKGKLVTRPPNMAGDGWISGENEDGRRHGCEHFWIADIRTLTGAEILDALGLEQGEVALVVGGPPCQGFSKAGRRDVMDPRNSLVFEFARLICEIYPRTFVMENVPAIQSMVTPEGVPVLDAFALAVSDGGYGEYDALRRALSTMDGVRAGVREAKTADRTGDDGKRIERPKPGRKVRAAAAAAVADQGQLDLFEVPS